AAGKNRHALRSRSNNLRDRSAESSAPARTGKRRQIYVCEERHNRNVAVFENEFKRHGKRVTENRILGISDIELVFDEFLEQVLRHFAMDRTIIIPAGKGRYGATTGNNRKRWNAAHGESFEVIATEKDHDIGLRFVEHFTQSAHSC